MAQLNIYGQDYKIIFKDHLNDGNHDLRGLCDKEKNTIFILSTQQPAEMFETVLHEISHAILWETGVTPTLHEAQEEILVENITRYIASNITAIAALIPKRRGRATKKK